MINEVEARVASTMEKLILIDKLAYEARKELYDLQDRIWKERYEKEFITYEERKNVI